MPKTTVFEVNRGGAWRKISVEKAIKGNERRGRCIECHKPVRPHRASTNGKLAARVEHLKGNPM